MNIKKTLAASVLAGAMTVTAAAAPASAGEKQRPSKPSKPSVTKVYKKSQESTAVAEINQTSGDANSFAVAANAFNFNAGDDQTNSASAYSSAYSGNFNAGDSTAVAANVWGK